jgi:hypothetical protein
MNFMTPQQVAIPKDAGVLPIDASEVVLHVSLFHPKKKTQVLQEYLVLGSQYLSDLRDKLECTIDSTTQSMLDGVTSNSGYFFIENVFYNDMRASGAIDYSSYVLLCLSACLSLSMCVCHSQWLQRTIEHSNRKNAQL